MLLQRAGDASDQIVKHRVKYCLDSNCAGRTKAALEALIPRPLRELLQLCNAAGSSGGDIQEPRSPAADTIDTGGTQGSRSGLQKLQAVECKWIVPFARVWPNFGLTGGPRSKTGRAKVRQDRPQRVIEFRGRSREQRERQARLRRDGGKDAKLKSERDAARGDHIHNLALDKVSWRFLFRIPQRIPRKVTRLRLWFL